MTTQPPTSLSDTKESKFTAECATSMKTIGEWQHPKPVIKPEVPLRYAENQQQLLENQVIRNLQHPHPPLFSNKTPQKNSNTDRVVNIFIQKITELHRSKNQDIDKKIMVTFNMFKKNVDCLTDDHRKKLLSIVPTIGEIIDSRNLDGISMITILYSLSKIKFCNKLNPNNTPVDECIQYEQTCKNLIDKILIKLPTYKNYQPREWSNIFYSLGLLAKHSAYVITSEYINNLLAEFNFDIQKQSITDLNPQQISNIFLGVAKLQQFNKLDSKSIITHSLIEYLLLQIKPSVHNFMPQDLSNTILSIARLAEFPKLRQLISKNKKIVVLLLQKIITNKNLIFKPIEIGAAIHGLGLLSDSIFLGPELVIMIRSTYNFLLHKIIPMASEISIETSNSIVSGIIKLITNNTITYDKPSEKFIRDILLNKVIADPSIINNKELHQRMYTIAFFQDYLTPIEIVKILKNITFFIPDANNLAKYFTSMGYLLVKTRNELANNKENPDLIALDDEITTEIRKVWKHFQSNIGDFDQEIRNAIHNTCSLIYEQRELTSLKTNYGTIRNSTFENTCIEIIKTLMPNPANLKRECGINDLPPIDACIIHPNGGMLAIEIQGSGHYLDDKGEHPSGKHLLKMARLKRENIKVIEVNGSQIMNFYDQEEIAAYLINRFLETNIEIRPEYCNNIPKLLRDAGLKS